MKFLGYICVVSLIFGVCSAGDIFESVHKCKFGPEFDGCIRNSLNTVLPMLQNGYKEYGIDPLDPLSIPYVKFAQKSTGAIQVKQEFFDTLVYNFANQTKFTKLRVDLDKNMIEMELFNPLLALKGTYKTEGKILVLQVNGGGKYFLNFHDITIRYTLKFKTVKRNGKNIWQFYESEGFYNPKKLTTYAEDLVKGQKEITDQMNAVFNENWKELWQDFEPIFSRSVGKVVLNYLNKIFAHIPIDETFKP